MLPGSGTRRNDGASRTITPRRRGSKQVWLLAITACCSALRDVCLTLISQARLHELVGRSRSSGVCADAESVRLRTSNIERAAGRCAGRTRLSYLERPGFRQATVVVAGQQRRPPSLLRELARRPAPAHSPLPRQPAATGAISVFLNATHQAMSSAYTIRLNFRTTVHRTRAPSRSVENSMPLVVRFRPQIWPLAMRTCAKPTASSTSITSPSTQS